MIPLERSAGAVLRRAVASARGREICAFLLASGNSEQVAFRVENCAGTLGAFIVPDTEVERMEVYARIHKLKVIAFIHSHMSSLELSEDDQRGLAKSSMPWIVVRETGDALAFRCYDRSGIWKEEVLYPPLLKS